VKLYLDANIIIFGHEADDIVRQPVLARLSEWCALPEGELVTPVFSRLECRVIPLRNDDVKLLAEYDKFFAGAPVEIVEVSLPIIELATALRASHGFKAPDAVHLATALHIGAKRFFTADSRLKRCPGMEIEVFPIPIS